MAERQLDDLLSTLDVCEEILPFDLQPVHIRRLDAIRAILKDHERDKEQRAPARVFTLFRHPSERERE